MSVSTVFAVHASLISFHSMKGFMMMMMMMMMMMITLLLLQWLLMGMMTRLLMCFNLVILYYGCAFRLKQADQNKQTYVLLHSDIKGKRNMKMDGGNSFHSDVYHCSEKKTLSDCHFGQTGL